MKKTTKIGTVVGGLLLGAAQFAGAQGYVNINNYDASAGVFAGSTATAAPISGANVTYFELLGGASAGSLSGVISDNTHLAINPLTDANGNGAGTGTFLDVGNGPVVGVASGGTGVFQVLVWEQPAGAANFANATMTFESATWSELTGTPPGTTPPTPANPTALAIALANPVRGSVSSLGGGNSALVMTAVPEPSIFALAGLGAAGFMSLRRRK